MTTAQVIFSIALGVATFVILAFAVFVVSTTMWGNRWVRVAAHRAKRDEHETSRKEEA